MIRAKFVVTEKMERSTASGPAITLAPVADDTIPEEQRLGTGAPAGSIQVLVDAPAAVAAFAMGAAFYVDFTAIA